jgi:hypothetical protein
MRMSRMARTPVPSALVLLMLSTALLAAMPAGAQQHGGSLLNTGNEITVIGSSATDGLGLSPAPGHVLIRDVTHLENPSFGPIDYGIVYVPPEFVMYTSYPKVLSFARDYTVSNFTVMISNVSQGFFRNITGLNGSDFRLDSWDPWKSAHYTWDVAVVEARGFNVTTVKGGDILLGDVNDFAILPLSQLGLPPIGPNREVADAADLVDLTSRVQLEAHELLVEGFYRLRLQNMTFLPGVNMTVELRFGGMAGKGGSMELGELLFTERPVEIEVYVQDELDVRLFSVIGTAETPVAPASSHIDEASGIQIVRFFTTTSFRFAVQPPFGEDQGTDWGMVARWAVLVIAIGIIVSIILYPGRKAKEGAEPIEEGDSPAGSETDDDEDDDENPEGAAPDDELARLEAERDAKVREMREQYAKGERGELSKDDVERLGDRARADVKRINQRIKELKREQAR